MISTSPACSSRFSASRTDWRWTPNRSANVRSDGTLRVEFSNGYGFTVAADECFAAWELYGKRHGYMACLPGGRVRVVRHDMPADDLVSERPAVRP